MAEVATLSKIDKMDEDEVTKPSEFQAQLDLQIPQNRDAAIKEGKLTEALENLLVLEKQTRLAADLTATTQLCVAIVKICRDCKDWKQLNSHVLLLAKRRAQLKQAITKYVQEAMTYIDELPTQELKYGLIEVLRTVTDGKIFVEAERARLTRQHAQMKEAEGKVEEASKILQEIQPETFGSLDRLEKTEFILEQIRLCLDTKDYVRASIISKKINPKVLTMENFQEMKQRFYTQIIRFYEHSDNYSDMSKSYRSIFDTEMVLADDSKWSPALRNAVIFLILSPHDPEQVDMMQRLHDEKKMEKIPVFKALLKCFITMELARWPLIKQNFGPTLETEAAFAGDLGKQRWEHLHKRVVEHNIRVVSSYYSRISMSRLSNLLDQSQQETENVLSDMVVKGQIYAKIDRPAGIVQFSKPVEATDLLNVWGSDISSLLGKVEKACHLINKENMLYKIAT